MESIRRKIDEKLICGVQGGLCVHICRFKLRLFFSAFVLSAVFIKAFLWRNVKKNGMDARVLMYSWNSASCSPCTN